MKRFPTFFLAAVIAAVSAAQPGRDAPPPSSPPESGATKTHPLVWDAMEKSGEPKPGDSAAAFVFNVTNTSGQDVTILQVNPSCGCTTANLPPTPWVLAAGAGGSVGATVDFTGKLGELTKSLYVLSTAGPQTLIMHVKIAPMDEAARARNLRIANADRQAVFRNDCAVCHAAPTKDKMGLELFHAACAVCHSEAHRANMVPDLLVAREHRDAAYWRKWIAEGRDGSLMPAFAEERGGPLTKSQVESLVEFALANLPAGPRAN